MAGVTLPAGREFVPCPAGHWEMFFPTADQQFTCSGLMALLVLNRFSFMLGLPEGGWHSQKLGWQSGSQTALKSSDVFLFSHLYLPLIILLTSGLG